MGAVNYFTSDYITMGLRPYDSWELENDSDFMEEMRRECEEYGGTIYQNDRNPAFPVRVRRCKKWVLYSCWFSRSCCWLRF